MLTLDVLGGVGGAACHNKGLWSQSQLPWEHDTLVCHSLVSDNGNQSRWELSNQIVHIRSLLAGQSQVIQFPFYYTDKRIAIYTLSKYIHQGGGIRGECV